MRVALLPALILAPALAFAHDWPDGPNKEFFQSLRRPDAWHGLSDFDRSCCGPGDIGKTKFKVAPGTERTRKTSGTRG